MYNFKIPLIPMCCNLTAWNFWLTGAQQRFPLIVFRAAMHCADLGGEVPWSTKKSAFSGNTSLDGEMGLPRASEKLDLLMIELSAASTFAGCADAKYDALDSPNNASDHTLVKMQLRFHHRAAPVASRGQPGRAVVSKNRKRARRTLRRRQAPAYQVDPCNYRFYS
jgi:hypothetical protein